MWPDVIDLKEFYSSRLGRVAQRLIVRRLRQVWPDVTGQNVLGLGYAPPYLTPFRGEAQRVMALMPALQGVLRWPIGERNVSVLADEADLPLPDRSFDRVLMVHALESSQQVQPMMRELWRVMSDGGRLLLVVPNRRGIWARFERTPFGQGHPYSPPQIRRLLRESMFTPVDQQTALYVPPARSRVLLRAAGALERVGLRWGNPFAGVLVVEAQKQLFAVEPDRRRLRARRRVYVPLNHGVARGAADRRR